MDVPCSHSRVPPLESSNTKWMSDKLASMYRFPSHCPCSPSLEAGPPSVGTCTFTASRELSSILKSRPSLPTGHTDKPTLVESPCRRCSIRAVSLEELELELGISNTMWVRTTRRDGILLICLYVDVYSYWYESVCVVVAVLVCLDLLVPFIVLVMYVADDIVNTHLSVLWHPSFLHVSHYHSLFVLRHGSSFPPISFNHHHSHDHSHSLLVSVIRMSLSGIFASRNSRPADSYPSALSRR